LFNIHFQFSQKAFVDALIKVLISLFLLFTIAPYRIEIPGDTPITLQTLVILFVAIGFGWKIGIISVMLYILGGAAGMPVFAGYKGGANILFGPYGGFFFGFIAASLICGFLAEMEAFRKPITAILNWLLGHVVIVLLGAIWLMRLDPGWQTKINDMLPGALIKSAVGALLIQLVIRFFSKKSKAAFTE
jgi:biotin transport system substrate-specific component